LFGGFALFGLLALWLHSAARSGEIGFNGSRGSASFHADLATQPEQFWGAIIFFSLLALAALTVSGLPAERFLFAGFLSPKSAARRRELAELAGIRATLILFEGGSRLKASLEDMAQVLGPRPAAVAREMTKLHETLVRGPLDLLAADPTLDHPRGEVVIVVAPGREAAATADDADAALTEALTRLSPGEAASEVARALGLPRRDLYRRALDLKGAG
jgi:16S rRNA (cytidine1402-2'-O)-methyltransferase